VQAKADYRSFQNCREHTLVPIYSFPFMSILETAAQLRRKLISPVELTKECLAKIDKLNPVLNAFITVTAESALREARAAEQEILEGRWRGPLHGIPIGLKDLVDTAGVRTTAASAVFKDRVPAQDAELVTRLRAAGAIILGKQNLHEFAYGGSSIISHFGAVHNPWGIGHITGGSSGGSAAAVAAGMCYGAIGTDTAGSIREPAALCGVVGLKPTFGRVSVRGVIPLSSSLDHVGPLTRSAADAAAFFDAVADDDPEAVPGISHKQSEVAPGARNLRVGVARAYFFEGLDAEVSTALDQALSVIADLVAELSEVNLAINSDRSLQAAEAYAYHADSVSRNAALYHPETLRRIRTGEKFTAGDRARLSKELADERRKIATVFDKVDALITPTVPVPAPEIAALEQNPETLRPTELLLLRNTRPFNVWGLPAISVPCGFTRGGLPIGMQIAGPHWSEGVVLALAHAYQQVTDWHKKEPGIG
jgi:aspartyl-tRNA(Asn)/glutamyl-tRNA(Gln) amidotransferase subunit A